MGVDLLETNGNYKGRTSEYEEKYFNASLVGEIGASTLSGNSIMIQNRSFFDKGD